ncbi:hypothetical protein T439DRAFT_377568 [Meredithblackwellia eburnea MCA 4105]
MSSMYHRLGSLRVISRKLPTHSLRNRLTTSPKELGPALSRAPLLALTNADPTGSGVLSSGNQEITPQAPSEALESTGGAAAPSVKSLDPENDLEYLSDAGSDDTLGDLETNTNSDGDGRLERDSRAVSSNINAQDTVPLQGNQSQSNAKQELLIWRCIVLNGDDPKWDDNKRHRLYTYPQPDPPEPFFNWDPIKSNVWHLVRTYRQIVQMFIQMTKSQRDLLRRCIAKDREKGVKKPDRSTFAKLLNRSGQALKGYRFKREAKAPKASGRYLNIVERFPSPMGTTRSLFNGSALTFTVIQVLSGCKTSSTGRKAKGQDLFFQTTALLFASEDQEKPRDSNRLNSRGCASQAPEAWGLMTNSLQLDRPSERRTLKKEGGI